MGQKSARTRQRIVDAALALFEQRGYEQATMREIAARAGVSLGSTYYYFRAKEDLIQAFYYQMQAAHVQACDPVLSEEKRFRQRLVGVMQAKLAVLSPYKPFAVMLFRTAANPQSPLNPFNASCKTVREREIETFRQVVEGSRDRIPKDLRPILPRLLWLYSMGIVLFWIHEPTPDARRTDALILASVELIVGLLKLSRLPAVGALRSQMVRLLEQF